MRNLFFLFILILVGCTSKEKIIEKCIEEKLLETKLRAEVKVRSKNNSLFEIYLNQNGRVKEQIKNKNILRLYFNRICADLYDRKQLTENSKLKICSIIDSDSICYDYDSKLIKDCYLIEKNNLKFTRASDLILMYVNDTLMESYDHLIDYTIPKFYPEHNCAGSSFIDVLYVASLEYKNENSYYNTKGCICLWTMQYIYYSTKYFENLKILWKVLQSMNMKALSGEDFEKFRNSK